MQTDDTTNYHKLWKWVQGTNNANLFLNVLKLWYKMKVLAPINGNGKFRYMAAEDSIFQAAQRMAAAFNLSLFSPAMAEYPERATLMNNNTTEEIMIDAWTGQVIEQYKCGGWND